MNWTRKKLKSKSGVSLAAALVFFLMCALVGTAALSAAARGGAVARERQLYRQTLALTSAANALRQELRQMTFTGAYRRIETVTVTVPEEGKTRVETQVAFEKGKGDTSPRLENSTLFRLEAEANPARDDLGLAAVYYRNQRELEDPGEASEPDAVRTLTFGPVEEKHIPQVTGTVTVGGDYGITVVLRSGENGLTMVFPARTAVKTTVAHSASGGGKTTVTTYTTTVTWDPPTVREGGIADEQASK